MKRLAAIIAFLVLSPVVGMASGNDAPPRNIDVDGPSQGVVPLNLEELWRVGGEDGEVIFGRITDVQRHSDGNVYVLDNQLCQVTVISPDGEFLRNISREGDGPGELRQPMALAFLSDEVLAVGMGFPGKLVSLGLDGTPLKSIFPIGEPADGNIGIMMSSKFRDGHLISSGGRIVFGDQHTSGHTERFLTVGGGDLTEFYRILETTTPVDPTGQRYVEANNYYIDMRWALGSGQKIYAPMKMDAYEVSVFDLQGKLLQVFGRQYKPRKRTQDEKDDVGPMINVAGRPEHRDWDISDHDECIVRIQYNHDDDTVWVLTGHGNNDPAPEILETWDVFGLDGEYLRQAPILLGHEINDGNAYLVGDNLLVIVRGTASSFGGDNDDEEIGEVEPLEVICYRIR